MGDYVHGPYWYGWSKVAPHECGVYFLLQDGLIQYIGRSRDILRRLRTHSHAPRIRSGEFTVEVHLVDFEESVRLEREWIGLIGPPLNDNYVLRNRKWREAR
jgi:excinuclease UvrABC nuclease subunit